MKESRFARQNSSKWKKYEELNTSDPDLLAERYIEITDDLAFARTFYPDSATTLFLNGLAAKFHLTIYRNKKESTNRFLAFWKFELPLVFDACRKELLYSLIFFALFAFIGALSAKYDPAFIRVILGDHYVNMTEENILRGDPFAVYKQENEFKMFFQIALNNIYVSFLVFLCGIFFSAGTLFQLLRNGVMLGVFECLFIGKGLGLQSLLVIWIHGTLEISAIVIAGGAGLLLGNSLLFPGTYTRLVSFMNATRSGLKIIVGLIPIFISAAFLESFITRHTEMPLWCSSAILVASATFIAWYVVVYPRRVAKRFNSTGL